MRTIGLLSLMCDSAKVPTIYIYCIRFCLISEDTDFLHLCFDAFSHVSRGFYTRDMREFLIRETSGVV